MSWDVARTVLEQGLLFGVMVLGVYLSFRVLSVPDLTVDGSFPLGGAVAATLIGAGYHPLAGLVAAMGAGALAGATTGVLHARLKVPALLAGILTMTALYSVNLRVMGRPNVALLRLPTLIEGMEWLGVPPRWSALALFVAVAIGLAALLLWFLRTELGLALRATGDNEGMAASTGIETGRIKTLGLAVSNALVAFSGALAAQYQGFADVNMGVGTIVAGLASVIVGEVLLRPRRLWVALASALVGSTGYRAAIAGALALGLAPSDLKLITALLVTAALALPALAGESHGPRAGYRMSLAWLVAAARHNQGGAMAGEERR